MPQDQLQDFFRDKKQRAQPLNVDWSAKRDAWINAVTSLYDRMENDYLKAAKNDVEISRQDKLVTEEHIGQYHIPELKLRVADEEVVFSPKGINIVGAKGRIDVEGDRGPATIIWQDSDQWSIVVSRTPRLNLVHLTADTFTDLLKNVMRP